jgi:hypothetical protein
LGFSGAPPTERFAYFVSIPYQGRSIHVSRPLEKSPFVERFKSTISGALLAGANAEMIFTQTCSKEVIMQVKIKAALESETLGKEYQISCFLRLSHLNGMNIDTLR